MTKLVEHYEGVVRLIERTVTNKVTMSGPLKVLSIMRTPQNVLSDAEVREIAVAMASSHLVYSQILEDEKAGV